MLVTRQDLQIALRTLGRRRGFTAVATVVLSLAIALNTVMYSVMDALVRPKLAMVEPQRLFELEFYGDYHRRLPRGARNEALQAGLHKYEAISGARIFGRGGSGSMMERGRQSHVGRVLAVRPDYFTVLGVRPRKGRLFGPADTTSSPSAVVSERLVRKLFPDGDDPLAQSVEIDGRRFGIVGVLPRGSDFCRSCVDAWVLPTSSEIRDIPLNIVRAPAGLTADQLERDLTIIANRVALAAGDHVGEARFRPVPAVQYQFAFRRFDFALIAAVLAVLFVACFNLANMQLVGGIGRTREVATRIALGASRQNLIAQLLLESSLVAMAGLAGGLLLTIWGTDLILASMPPSVGNYIVEPQLSWRVFVFAAASSALCLLIVGLVPAILVSRVDPNVLLKAGAGTGTHKRNQRRYGMLVVAQLGLALALLSGAALVGRQAWRIAQVRFAYDPKPLVSVWRYFRRPEQGTATFSRSTDDMIVRARAVPGVSNAAAYAVESPEGHAVTVTDAAGTVEHPAGLWGYRVVTAEYLRTMAIPVIRGRDFMAGERDVAVAIVDERMARTFWPNADPIGAMIKLGDARSGRPWVRVVGIARDEMRDGELDRSTSIARATMGLGRVVVLGTDANGLSGNKIGASINLVVRASQTPERLPSRLLRTFRDLPETILLRVQPMEEALGIARQRANHNFVASIFGLFATLAVSLSGLGIYGVVAQSVAERRREIGVRIALGASSRDVLGAVLRDGTTLALAGVAVGLLLTKFTAGWLTAFSLEDDQYDAVLFGGMAIVLFALTVLAAVVPALRATRIDPVEALRSE